MSSKPSKTEREARARVDRVVEDSERLQAVLRGEEILLFPPGGAAFIGTHMSLLMGWGLLASLFVVKALLSREPWWSGMVLLAGAVGALLVSVLPGFLVVWGYTSAHDRVQQLCRVLVWASIAFLGVAAFWADGPAVVVQCGACLLLLVADRLVNGPSYTLAAAFFRARRRQRILFQKARDEVLNR